MFSVSDAADIKQIAVGGPGTEDFLAWNYTKSGVFTVRSAYHLRMSMKKCNSGQPEPSSSVKRHKGYLALWDTNALGKAKIHMWRMIRNGLAVGAELHRRRIKPGVFCVACGREETIVHRFWTCQHSNFFWRLMEAEKGVVLQQPPTPMVSHNDLARWLLNWFEGASAEERETLVQASYGLWLARNDARDGKKISPPHEIMELVARHMQEWKRAHQPKVRSTVAKPIQKWEVPVAGWIKFNADGAISKAGMRAGGGVVARDEHGALLAAACHFFSGVTDPELKLLKFWLLGVLSSLRWR